MQIDSNKFVATLNDGTMCIYDTKAEINSGDTIIYKNKLFVCDDDWLMVSDKFEFYKVVEILNEKQIKVFV